MLCPVRPIDAEGLQYYDPEGEYSNMGWISVQSNISAAATPASLIGTDTYNVLKMLSLFPTDRGIWNM